MGSPSYCYKAILEDFIYRYNNFNENNKEINNTILNKNVKELENIVLTCYNQNKNYSIFLMGICVDSFINKWYNCGDMINACLSAISEIENLFEINEE